MAEVVKKQSQRMLALDILRGITIAGMLLVNNPGSWSHMYRPLGHASWNGLTPTDLIFPFFMFIMGISTFISMRKFEFKMSKSLLFKIIKRTIVIFAIGLGIAWFSKLCYGIAGGKSFLEAANSFDTIRILGVMPRLALCYGAASIIVLLLRCKHILWVVATLLVGYGVILLVDEYGLVFSEQNIVSVIDQAVLGVDHMYKDTIDGVKLALDPEGLLSTIPSIAHVLIGFWAGMKMMEEKDINMRVNRLFIIGAILMTIGFLFDYAVPINKKLWTPTFALVTCGLASTFLALLIWIIDIKGYKKWCRFFEAFGINPLFLYVLGGVLGIIFGSFKFGDPATSLKGHVYGNFLVPVLCDETLASCIYAVLFIVLCWSIGYYLYKKKIYIKI
ncbi:MAG: DUF5009 domain-containing protein [Muribaculaceae bacterium]|nr:DUF5009 domain-containing protein [Muribaculaceae bacterium]